jgi:hypothetical protein
VERCKKRLALRLNGLFWRCSGFLFVFICCVNQYAGREGSNLDRLAAFVPTVLEMFWSSTYPMVESLLKMRPDFGETVTI